MSAKKKKSIEFVSISSDPTGNPLPKEILNGVTMFQRKQKKGIIDVWWLYDDGGITFVFQPVKWFIFNVYETRFDSAAALHPDDEGYMELL